MTLAQLDILIRAGNRIRRRAEKPRQRGTGDDLMHLARVRKAA